MLHQKFVLGYTVYKPYICIQYPETLYIYMLKPYIYIYPEILYIYILKPYIYIPFLRVYIDIYKKHLAMTCAVSIVASGELSRLDSETVKQIALKLRRHEIY